MKLLFGLHGASVRDLFECVRCGRYVEIQEPTCEKVLNELALQNLEDLVIHQMHNPTPVVIPKEEDECIEYIQGFLAPKEWDVGFDETAKQLDIWILFNKTAFLRPYFQCLPKKHIKYAIQMFTNEKEVVGKWFKKYGKRWEQILLESDIYKTWKTNKQFEGHLLNIETKQHLKDHGMEWTPACN